MWIDAILWDIHECLFDVENESWAGASATKPEVAHKIKEVALVMDRIGYSEGYISYPTVEGGMSLVISFTRKCFADIECFNAGGKLLAFVSTTSGLEERFRDYWEFELKDTEQTLEKIKRLLDENK